MLERLGRTIAKAGAKIVGNAIPGGGVVVDLVAEALGVDSDDPDRIEEAIAKDPQAAVKLKALEMKHREAFEKLALQHAQVRLKEEELHQADRASARARELAFAKTTGKRDLNLYLLAWTVIVGYFLLLGLLMHLELPPGATGYVNQLFGALAAGFGMVLQYFFGSSRSSSEKTALLTRKADKG